MSTVAERQTIEAVPKQALAWGLRPIPLRASDNPKQQKIPAVKAWQRRTFAPSVWRTGQGTGLVLGKQQSGLYLYCADIDSHSGTQDAPTFLSGVLNTIPHALTNKLFRARSTGGAGRYIMFFTPHEIPNGLLRDQHGNKAGEFLGEGRHVVYPDPSAGFTARYLPFLCLTITRLALCLTPVATSRATQIL